MLHIVPALGNGGHEISCRAIAQKTGVVCRDALKEIARSAGGIGEITSRFAE